MGCGLGVCTVHPHVCACACAVHATMLLASAQSSARGGGVPTAPEAALLRSCFCFFSSSRNKLFQRALSDEVIIT